MVWVDLPDPADAEGSLAAAFAAGEVRYGQVLQAWRAVGMVDGAFEAYLPYLSAIVGPGSVPIRIKDLSALRVAILNRCRYTISHRVDSARRNDLTEAEILAMAVPATTGPRRRGGDDDDPATATTGAPGEGVAELVLRGGRVHASADACAGREPRRGD